MLWTRILGQRLICINSYDLIRRANLFGGLDTIELLIRMLSSPTNLSRTCRQNPSKVSQLLTFLHITSCCYDWAKCREVMYIHIAQRINLAALGWTVTWPRQTCSKARHGRTFCSKVHLLWLKLKSNENNLCKVGTGLKETIILAPYSSTLDRFHYDEERAIRALLYTFFWTPTMWMACKA